MRSKLLLSLFLIININLIAYDFPSSLVTRSVNGNQVYLEPTLSYATYTTEENEQNGYLYGISGAYDLLVFNAPYFGFESHYKSGKIKNHEFISRYTDYLFEGKLGYTKGLPLFELSNM